MTNARPDALSLVVAVAISSSIIATQTLADRRLQMKSVDIQGKEQVEFTQSEVMVQPTLGRDQQPIPKSFTTTYPDQTEVRAGYDVPSEGFTDVLSGIEGGVASVDLFETDENDVAQKYTKVLKVGNEGVFRFTHNLAGDELVIEVRKGMTDQNSIAAVRAQSGDIQPLEPLTKIANREQLTGVLRGANERAGSLGEADHYVALATIEVDKVAVNGRSFMRHIVSGDQPPEIQRLGQSLFINDEALLAAATSAYAQVHVLGEDIQQEALDKLLSYHKPVGYVVHPEDHTEAYPVPAGYPRLEVDQASEEVVVFRGQKQNPTDIAFVESQLPHWEDYQFLELTAEVKKASIRSYMHVIRSRQMALLEEFAADLTAQHDAKLNEDKLSRLAYYEAFQQALTAAAPDGTDEFEFTTAYIRIATSVITPIWMQLQLIKNFSFKPVLKNLLTNYNFFQNLHNFISFANRVMNLFVDAKDTKFSSFSSKVVVNLGGQLLEIVTTQEKLKASSTELTLAVKKLEDRLTAMAIASDKDKLKLKQSEQTFEHVSKELRQEFVTTKNIIDQLRHDFKRIPELQKQVSDALADLAKVRSAHSAAKLGIDGWDDTLTPEEQAGLLENKIHETGQSTATAYVASGLPREQDMKATLAAIEGQLGIVPDNENNLGGRSQSILNHLQQQADQSSEIFLNQLAFVEGQLGLVTNSNDDPEARQKIILEQLFLQLTQISQQQPPTMNKNVRDAEAEKRANINTQVTAEPGIDNRDDTRPLDKQASAIREKILEIKRSVAAKLQQLDEEVFKAGQPDVNERIAAIDNELDRQIARLGTKPRYLLDRDAARARWLLAEAESELEVFHRRLNTLRSNQDYANADGRSESHEVEDEQLLTGKKSTQVTGGDDGTVGKIRHLVQEQAHLEDEIEIRKADIERLKEVLKTAEQAVENDGGPFQYSPGQVKVRTAMDTFAEQHALKKQALETTMGLAQLGVESGKKIPHLPTFDFDDEFAPIHMQALVGDKLTFKQASGIVEVFKSLKEAFPESSLQPVGDLPGNDLKEVYRLVRRARHEMQKGALEYDDEIRSMGKAAVHFIRHQSGYLKSFPEYFATHSASGNKIISLLREGLISKVELENYIKAVRSVNGYQTVAEFEHFLGYKHGVKLPEFRKVVQMLSDKGADEFMQSAFTPVPVTASGPAGIKESVTGMKDYAAAVIANYLLDDIAFDNGRRTAAFLTHVQGALTPYAHAAGLSESELIEAVHGTLMQAHAAAVERQLLDYWIKPSAFLVQAVTWYFSSYKPLLTTHTAGQATALSLLNMSFLYFLDLTNRGDYLHRVLTPFQHWLERLGVDPDRTGQYACHSRIEQISEVGGLAMPLGKAASSVILLKTGSMLFARQYNANPQMYRSASRLVPEIVKSMGSGQGVQIPLLHRMTPQKVKTLASATTGLVLGPVATVGAYAHGLISGFTYAQTFGFALASSLTFDFFMNDNKMLTQWLGGPLGRSLDKINRWTGVGETTDEYAKRTSIATPQRFDETDKAYANRVKANNTLYGWTRQENFLHLRERRDRTMKLFGNGWEKYFRQNLPKWSFSHAQSIPYFYTFGAFYKWQQGNNKKVPVPEKRNARQSSFRTAASGDRLETDEKWAK
ncbi:hypothetical protein [Endozoicomonas sp. 8E]|uniref:hypothetical protein n=1 Tax=Endozoicomonas sp. 8E TaxID=3035692 RepID=UPI002938DBA5|nr:hypothetical protein [Endozoicomonas sp. 8E]WOG29596.1 hypothetical protein P6910_08070 [Endozoicomonas sp. 8E]